MDEHQRELANRLFANAMAMLEDAAGVAAAGQSSRTDATKLVDSAQGLSATVWAVAVIAEAAAIVVKRGAETGQDGPKSPC